MKLRRPCNSTFFGEWWFHEPVKAYLLLFKMFRNGDEHEIEYRRLRGRNGSWQITVRQLIQRRSVATPTLMSMSLWRKINFQKETFLQNQDLCFVSMATHVGAKYKRWDQQVCYNNNNNTNTLMSRPGITNQRCAVWVCTQTSSSRPEPGTEELLRFVQFCPNCLQLFHHGAVSNLPSQTQLNGASCGSRCQLQRLKLEFSLN